MYEEKGQGYTIYYAGDRPHEQKENVNSGSDNADARVQNTEKTGSGKSSAQRLRDDPNIEIVTKVPGLVWDIRYRNQPIEVKRHGVFSRIFGRKGR